jgi:hypothetical protein
MPKQRDPIYVSPAGMALREPCFRRDGYRRVALGCQTPTQELTCDHIQVPRRGQGPLAPRSACGWRQRASCLGMRNP